MRWLDEQFGLEPDDRERSRNSLASYEDSDDLLGTPLNRSREDPEVILFAEFIGTFFLVFVGVAAVFCSSAITLEVLSVPRLFYVSFAYGMVYASLMYDLSFLSPSDGHARHLNPAISVSMYFLGRLDYRRLFLYMTVQISGGLLAILLVHFSTPDIRRVSFTVLDNVTYFQEILMSVIVSFISIFVLLVTNFHNEEGDSMEAVRERVNLRSLTMTRVDGAPPDIDADVGRLASAYSRHNQPLNGPTRTFHSSAPWSAATGKDQAVQTIHESNAIMSGLILFLCSCIGSTISGGFMNPAVSLSLAVLTGDALVAPVIGPFIGAILAGGVLFITNTAHYRKLRTRTL